MYNNPWTCVMMQNIQNVYLILTDCKYTGVNLTKNSHTKQILTASQSPIHIKCDINRYSHSVLN